MSGTPARPAPVSMDGGFAVGDTSKIEWTDATWNPLVGCTKVSPGCDHCYAETVVDTRLHPAALAAVADRASRVRAIAERATRANAGPCVLDVVALDQEQQGCDTRVRLTSYPRAQEVLTALRQRGYRAEHLVHGSREVVVLVAAGERLARAFPTPFATVSTREHLLTQPLRWRTPKRVFVNSLSDLFHRDVPDDFIARVFAVMALAQQHTFQLLTKRHGRMRSLLSDMRFRDQVRWAIQDPRMPWPLPNVWLGVSVEDQARADLRVPALLETPAAVRFLSCEPLLGPVDVTRFVEPQEDSTACGDPDHCNPWLRVETVDWVIVGGESGKGARPMHPDWARSLRDQCARAGVPFLFKQWGEWQDGSAGPGQHGEDHIIVADGRHEPAVRHQSRDLPYTDLAKDRLTHRAGTHRAVFISRVGKKSAGRELDGVTHDGYPS